MNMIEKYFLTQKMDECRNIMLHQISIFSLSQKVFKKNRTSTFGVIYDEGFFGLFGAKLH